MPQRKTYRWIYNLLTALVLIWAATASAIDWENETQLCRYVIQRDGTETNKAFRARHYAPDRQIDIKGLWRGDGKYDTNHHDRWDPFRG